MNPRALSSLLLALLLLGGAARQGAAQSTPVYNPANGHWYQLVRVPPGSLSWTDARNAAQALSYAGYPGHLVTATSAAEEQFVVNNVLGGVSDSEWWWMGGYQDTTAPDYREPAGGWRWVTGEPWSYTDWAPNQPDNGSGIENFLGYFTGKQWNDFADTNTNNRGYVVEFEPPVSPGAANAAALVLFPNPTLGGQPALGQVTLAQTAGAGGEVLTLTSSNPAAAAVPASVTVPAGASSVTFVITPLPVAAPTPVTIAAACAFGPVTAVLTVLPLPASPAPVGANLLVNGSFEAPAAPEGGFLTVGPGGLPGWQISRGTVDVLNEHSWQAAPDGGTQSLDLVGTPGAATIEQSFPTQPGRGYLFSGFVSHNPGVPYGRATVLLNEAPFVQLAHNLPNRNAEMKWQFFSYLFRATAATTTLTISDATGIDDLQGTALDGLSVTPVDGAVPPVNAAADLPAPTNLFARLLPGAGVQLLWQDNSSDENAFAVWRRAANSDWTRIAVLAPNTTDFLDPNVAPGTSYTYRVRATRGNVASDWSNPVTVTTLAGVSG